MKGHSQGWRGASVTHRPGRSEEKGTAQRCTARPGDLEPGQNLLSSRSAEAGGRRLEGKENCWAQEELGPLSEG